jgi:putative endonuclease
MRDSSQSLGVTKKENMREYYVYIMSSLSRTLYTGVTNDLMRRVLEHKQNIHKGFTAKYSINMLVYYESTDDISVAIMREKQIKGMSRSKKIALIESMNPEWADLSKEWFEDQTAVPGTPRKVVG